MSLLINGIAYSFADFSATGLPGLGDYITSIKWKRSRKKKIITTKGPNPKAMTYGPKSFEGSLTLPLEGHMIACDLAKAFGSGPEDIPPFPLVCTYASSGTPTCTVTFNNLAITDVDADGGSSDSENNATVTYNFICTDIIEAGA